MPPFLSKRRYELVGLAVGLLFAIFHVSTSRPRAGMGNLAAAVSAPVRVVQTVEGRANDFQFRLRGERKPHPDVLIVEADEKSAQRFGQWPWSRALFGQAISNLIDANVASIGMDITFMDPAPDLHAGERALLSEIDAVPSPTPELKQIAERLRASVSQSPDLELAAAMRKAGKRLVQGTIVFPEGDRVSFDEATLARFAKDIQPALIKEMPGRTRGSLTPVPMKALLWTNWGVQTPLSLFSEAGTSFGYFSTVPDVDGTIRRVAAISKLTSLGGLLPSMGLQAAAVKLGASVIPTLAGDAEKVADMDISGLALVAEDKAPVELEFEAQAPFVPLNYLGPGSVFPHLSLVDVVDKKFDAKALDGKVVLFGVTLVGNMGDQRVTPFKELEAGVYTHATLVSNILSQDFLRRPLALYWAEVLALLLLGLAMGAIIPRVRSFLIKGLLIFGALSAWAIFDQAMLLAGYQVTTLWPLLDIGVASFGVVFLGYLSVDREKLKMRSTFQRYLGEDVMEAALQNPDRLNIGEKREMTVMFSDIRGFTTLSERMTPEALASFINEYLSPMTKIVFDTKGTLDKYIGDAVMAFWNAPLDVADHGVQACRAAVLMLEKLEELKKDWRARGFPELEIGIGINTGFMVVGNMGSDVRVDYTVLGDSVNLGSRLEGTNKEYDTRVIISEFTYAHVKDEMVCRRLGAVRVKGKTKPVGIYELRGIGRPAGPEAEAITAFDQALNAWTARRWDDATAAFGKVLTIWPNDYTAKKYLAEIEEFRAHPPGPDWDGVVSLKTK